MVEVLWRCDSGAGAGAGVVLCYKKLWWWWCSGGVVVVVVVVNLQKCPML
jgi:hypothetical protein